MAKKWKVWIEPRDFSANVLKSPELTEVLKEQAQSMAQAAGEGYTAEIRERKTRNYAIVKAETIQAQRDNMKHNTLLKVVGNR